MTNTYTYRMRTGLSLQQPTGVWTNQFGYDAAKRLTSVISPAGTFAYTLAATAPGSAQIKQLLLPNTSYITNTYDGNARLLSTTLKNSSHSILNSNSYSYNPGNQRTQQVFSVGSTYNYTYDPIGQLKVADSATASEDRGYAYDAAWNLNKLTNNGSVATFNVDSRNQLTSASGVSYIYDGNGNLTNHFSYHSKAYDDENRLIQVADWTYYSYRSDFAYDGAGRLRQRTDYEGHVEYIPEYGYNKWWTVAGEVRYVYDGMRVIQERDGSNVPQVSYTRGTDLSGSLEGAGGIGGMLARTHGYSSGNWSTHNFYHADGNGNITYLVNSSQTLAASYRYDAFGNILSISGVSVTRGTY